MKEELFTDFQEVSAKAWKQKIQYDLKGADYNEKLVWESPEGIKVKPFYHADDRTTELLPAPTAPKSWNIVGHISVETAATANARALHALKNGADSIRFSITSAPADLKALYQNIALEHTEVTLDFQDLPPDAVQYLGTLQNDPLALNLDPIGKLARSGNWYRSMKDDFELLDTLLLPPKALPQKNTISVDASLYQNAGATMVQQLAYALAHANEYLNRYPKLTSLNLKVAVGGNYFFEIAKIRALRKLFNLLAPEYNSNLHCHIEAFPSQRNKTLYDYNMNMIRTTTEGMSAVLGGADAVSSLNYDFIYHHNNEFAERMARNQLLILKTESYFNSLEKVADGSYYIESLTDQLAEKALLLFKNIEAGGGFLKQLKQHTLQKKIKESAQKEQLRFDNTQEVLVGSNAYSNREDQMKSQLDRNPFMTRRAQKTLIEPIIPKRLSEKLERERLQQEGWQERSNQ
ncbi:methylmalonyl-CoA mutase subunit beta [Zobellia galactanivorans]|uniref:Methylmalonyl-CoA mutase small subunit n=1 Tax=Zobellia galactanivorans (strain DSM 12802 / CCUG 47099 / CIP 106680 / NCIMB 13871 / Dsij) TaxID=63186 RepID=G0LAA6_ZOBGA|nr:methylmalonyl-CoA mutase subunit beta [Zobellia galactanivorans]CAZ95183.1 Methylmalonyl-CoA mutase small subunit [Zobellia galactanivorans]